MFIDHEKGRTRFILFALTAHRLGLKGVNLLLWGSSYSINLTLIDSDVE